MESLAREYFVTRRRSLSSTSKSGRSAIDDTYDLALLPPTGESDVSRELGVSGGPVSEAIRSTLREIKNSYEAGNANSTKDNL